MGEIDHPKVEPTLTIWRENQKFKFAHNIYNSPCLPKQLVISIINNNIFIYPIEFLLG